LEKLFKKKINQLAEISEIQRSNKEKLKILVMNEIFFILIAPWSILLPAYFICSYFNLGYQSDFVKFSGLFMILFGLLYSFIAVKNLWELGLGTPAMNAPTEKMVVTGVYRYSRNPIQFAALVYLTGLGFFVFSLPTGLIALTAGSVVGVLYIKLIEEKELRLRYGSSYEEYMCETSFIIPMFKRRNNDG